MQDKIPKPSASGDKNSVLKNVGAYTSSIDLLASNENQVYPHHPLQRRRKMLDVVGA